MTTAAEEPARTDADADLPPPKPSGSALAFYLRVLRPHRLLVALLFLGLVVDVAFQAGVPIAMRALIDRALIPREVGVLRLVLAALAVGTVVACVTAVGRDILYARIGSAVPNDLRRQLFGQLQRLPTQFYARTETGQILTRFSTDLEAVEAVVSTALPLSVLGAVGVLIYLVLLFMLEPRLAAITLVGMPLSALGPIILGKRATAAGIELRTQDAELLTSVQENVFANAVVRLFNLRVSARSAFERRVDKAVVLGARFSILTYLAERVPNLAVLLMQLGLFVIGAYLVYDGSLTVGALVAFHALFVSLAASVALLTQQMPVIIKASSGVARILELLDEPGQDDAPGAGELARPEREITLRDVSFGYSKDRSDLRDVSLAIPQGAFVALVGPSGSGKSTVLNLLTRFYDPRAGAVLVDGADLKTVTQDSWYRHLAVVFQESFLFNTTVRENIRVGRPDASDDEVASAARAAEIHEDILRMPDGYDTAVGARGGRLSGGQRQRVAIARALLRDPAVLLLDEATSALDPGTEAAINATLARVAKGRTVVSVTHRLSSVRHADRIFVFERGRLVEQGAHGELVARAGLYAGLAVRQGGITVSPDGARAQVEVSRLRLFPPFSPLPQAMLEELAGRLVTTHLPPGATVIREGERGDWFYIIARGTVVAWKLRQGVRREVGTLHDGDYFGEVALLRDAPRAATVETLAATTLLGVDRATLHSMIDRAPALREALHRDFAATINAG